MCVLQFAFEALKPNPHSPHAHSCNCAVYTGTHDNDTTVGWYQNAAPEVQDYTRRYLGVMVPISRGILSELHWPLQLSLR